MIIPAGMKKKPGIELKVTGDGSVTLYVPSLGEHYHSIYGAIQESRHVFIEAGLAHASRDRNELAILEVGMGTGLNAWLTVCTATDSGTEMSYVAIEPQPLGDDIIDALNYPRILAFPRGEEIFRAIHSSDMEQWVRIAPGFRLFKFGGTLEDFRGMDLPFGLVYFDAFGPNVQPDIWSPDNFAKIFGMMEPGGVLVTYSAKGDVKRALKSAGFLIEKLLGPPGKREMLRATRPFTSPGSR